MKNWIKWALVALGVALIGVGIYMIWGKGLINQTRTEEISVLLSPTPIPENRKPLKFAVMADIHNDLVSLKQGLIEAKARGNDFVVIDGDMTLNGNQSELEAVKKILDQGGIKYYAVPGNHDLWKGLNEYKSVFGEDYGLGLINQALTEEIKIILIDNGSWKGLGSEQTAWIRTETEECKIRYCLILMHMPLNHNFSKHIMGEDSKTVAVERQLLISLFNQNGVKEIITGHLHYTTSYNLENLHTTIVGAVSKDRNNQTPRFTEFKVNGDSLESEVVEI